MSLHIAFVNVAADGHVAPTLTVVRELVRRGHRVTYPCTPRTARAVAESGADVLVHPEPRVPADVLGDRVEDVSIGAFERSLGALEAMIAHFDRDHPDVVVHDMLAKPPGQALGRRYGVPTLTTFPTFASNERFSLLDAVSRRSGLDRTTTGPLLRARVYRFMAEHDLTCTTVEEFLGFVPEFGLVFLPRSYQLFGSSFDRRYAFVGPCLGDRALQGTWTPPATGRPLLLVSTSTVGRATSDFLRRCVEAWADLPWNVIMSVGAASLPEVPPNVEVRDGVPQSAVLRRADVLLCQAGMGATMQALANGVPVVTAPVTAEQGLVAERACDLGVGLRVDPRRDSAEVVRETVRSAAVDCRVASSVRSLRKEIDSCGGAARAADEIEMFRARHPTRPRRGST